MVLVWGDMTHTVHVERIKGITDILIIDLPGARSAYVTFNLYSGFRQAISEDRRLYHVPHLLEHMVFDGSQAYPSVEQLGAELSEGGAIS